MRLEKGLIVLDTFELGLVSKCPYSLKFTDVIRAKKRCARCQYLSDIARYVLSRSFRGTNSPSIKTLTNRYNNILLEEGHSEDERKLIVRKDIGILSDLLDFASKFNDKIDVINPEIKLHFGRFLIQDNLDAVFCIDGQYYLVQFFCDDHDISKHKVICYETIAGSLWLRTTYGVNDNAVLFIQLCRSDPPLFQMTQMTASTQRLHQSVDRILDYLEPQQKLKNEKDLTLYKKELFKQLPIRFGGHCWDCMACFKL